MMAVHCLAAQKYPRLHCALVSLAGIAVSLRAPCAPTYMQCARWQCCGTCAHSAAACISDERDHRGAGLHPCVRKIVTYTRVREILLLHHQHEPGD